MEKSERGFITVTMNGQLHECFSLKKITEEKEESLYVMLAAQIKGKGMFLTRSVVKTDMGDWLALTLTHEEGISSNVEAFNRILTIKSVKDMIKTICVGYDLKVEEPNVFKALIASFERGKLAAEAHSGKNMNKKRL